MVKIKRNGKERKRDFKNPKECNILHPCSEVPDDVFFTKYGV